MHLLHAILRAAFRRAVALKQIKESPVVEVSLPKVSKRRGDKGLPPSDLLRFLLAAKDSRFYPLFLVLSTGGLRPGQALAGVDIELFERGSGSGTEQGVDQRLQVHMLRALADTEEPATAVLLTGDGAGYQNGDGFHANMERLAKRGRGIEVISWDVAVSKRLKAWATEAGVYIPLESYYSVTFIAGGRRSVPLNLTHRRTSEPKKRTA